jgi:hypothetical protein
MMRKHYVRLKKKSKGKSRKMRIGDAGNSGIPLGVNKSPLCSISVGSGGEHMVYPPQSSGSISSSPSMHPKKVTKT